LQTKAADGKLADADLQALAAVDVTADSLITQLNTGKLYTVASRSTVGDAQ